MQRFRKYERDFINLTESDGSIISSPWSESLSVVGPNCYERFFKTYQHGVFVEIGADDGTDKSNSLFFERLGWEGLCVEASPTRFDLLKENRKCCCANVAVWDKKEKAQFLDISGWGKGLSGIIENYDEKHIKRIGKELCHPDNMGYHILEVECIY